MGAYVVRVLSLAGLACMITADPTAAQDVTGQAPATATEETAQAAQIPRGPAEVTTDAAPTPAQLENAARALEQQAVRLDDRAAALDAREDLLNQRETFLSERAQALVQREQEVAESEARATERAETLEDVLAITPVPPARPQEPPPDFFQPGVDNEGFDAGVSEDFIPGPGDTRRPFFTTEDPPEMP